MPQTELYFYQEEDGDVPVRDWLADLRRRERPTFRRVIVAIERLREAGHGLRRPHAAPLRDGIHELRVGTGHVNYRLLYFFHGRNVALLAHGLTKERTVPPADIDRAVARRRRFEADPDAHRHEEQRP